MARSMARRRDHSEGAAGERLDHQEEQRLQRGTPKAQVILLRLVLKIVLHKGLQLHAEYSKSFPTPR